MSKQTNKQFLFPTKLNEILSNKQLQQFINWGQQRGTIEIPDIKVFEDNVLSIYFRHQNFESFIRQMNLYGFRKNRNCLSQVFTSKQLKNGKNINQLQSRNQKIREKQKKQQLRMMQLEKQNKNQADNQAKQRALKQTTQKDKVEEQLPRKQCQWNQVHNSFIEGGLNYFGGNLMNGSQIYTFWPMNYFAEKGCQSGYQYMFFNNPN